MTRVDKPIQPTATRTWRMNAVRLAHERSLVGKAILREKKPDYDVYGVPSISEPVEHTVKYVRKGSVVECDCMSAVHGRPCAHAGAVLLLVTGLAPESGRAD